jgi:nitrogen fixation protein FixH
MAAAATPAGTLTGRKVLLIFVCFFGTIFAVNAWLVVAAIGSWTGMEADSPYKAGLLYNRELAVARTENARGWTLKMHADRLPEGTVRVSAEAHDAAGAALTGRILTAVLERPTDKRADRTATLAEERPGAYAAVLDGVAPGQWELVVDVLEDGERAFRRRSRIILR